MAVYTHKRYRIKKLKTLKLKNKTVKGGTINTLPVKSIFLTDPIFKAIKKLNPDFKPTGFKKEPGNQGFILHRLNQNQNLSQPITVKKYSKNPKYFSIIDGRHRFSKLVARGNTNITVNIVD